MDLRDRSLAMLLVILCLLTGGVVGEAIAGDYDWITARNKAVEEETKFFGGQYLSLRGGGFLPEVSISGSNTKFDVGVGAEISYGIRPIKYFAIEAGFGYYEADYISDHPDYYNDPVYLMSVVPVKLTVKGIFPAGFAEFYGLGGVGMHYVMMSKRYATLPANTPVYEDKDDDISSALHYGGGVSFKFGNASVSLEAVRTAGLRTALFSKTFDISGTFASCVITLGF